MISIEEINNLQKDIDRKDRIIKVLKERVRQWVKEYNILDGIIDMYKMSENEAKEIIAELKAENAKLKEEMTELEEKFLTLNGKSYSYYTTLQAIKKIGEYIITSDTEKWTLDEPFKQIEKILELTKAEEE